MVILRKSGARARRKSGSGQNAPGSTQNIPGFPRSGRRKVLASDRPNFHLYHVHRPSWFLLQNGSPNSTPIIWP